MNKSLSSIQKAYLAGFLDGDGSIYVRSKPNTSYKYGYQIAPYIVLFQSAKEQTLFEVLVAMINLGYLRKRKDGVLEYIIGKEQNIIDFLVMVGPYLILKARQADLMIKILESKSKVDSRKDFIELVELVDSFRELNYSKKRVKRILTP